MSRHTRVASCLHHMSPSHRDDTMHNWYTGNGCGPSKSFPTHPPFPVYGVHGGVPTYGESGALFGSHVVILYVGNNRTVRGGAKRHGSWLVGAHAIRGIPSACPSVSRRNGSTGHRRKDTTICMGWRCGMRGGTGVAVPAASVRGARWGCPFCARPSVAPGAAALWPSAYYKCCRVQPSGRARAAAGG